MQIGTHIEVRWEFKPEDVWVGIFWRRRGPSLDMWIIPLTICFPLHIIYCSGDCPEPGCGRYSNCPVVRKK